VGLTKERGAALLALLSGDLERKARVLIAAGWEEDGRGLWSKGRRRNLSLFDAHEVARQQETCNNGDEGTR
jgi:hypothetical protein